MEKRNKIISVLTFVIIVPVFLIIVRLILPSWMDDVTPSRLCDERLLSKSRVLMVIPLNGDPLYDNRSIADDPVWCEHIQELNKTLGMHGIYHTENEFMYARDKNYIKLGMEEFNKCFGFYPNIFEAPQLSLSRENEKILREMNFTIIKLPHLIMHKEYHCTDYENKSWLVKLNYLNKLI